MVDTHITKIIFVYKNYQPQLFDSLKNRVEFRKHIQEEDLTPEALNYENCFLILDDVFSELSDTFLYNLFVSVFHHSKLSVCLILQYLFLKSKVMRPISSNTYITVLFKNRRDALSIKILNSQLYPNYPGFLNWAYSDATADNYSSLTLDHSPEADPLVSVRKTPNFDNEDEKIICYIPERK